MMHISTFFFLFRRGLRNLGKHWAMTIACIASLSVCMTLNTFASLAEVNVDSLVSYLGTQNETVVYLDLKKDFPFWSSDARFGVYPVARVEFKNDGVFVNGTRVLEHGLNTLKNACLRKAEQ